MKIGRHARSKWDWGGSPSRNDELNQVIKDETEGKRPPGKKDPSRCKGNHGGPHIPEIILRPHPSLKDQCYWSSRYDRETKQFVIAWHCQHEEHCAGCGRIFRWIGMTECPAHPGDPAQKIAAQQHIDEWNKRRRVRRKPVINGPQGYRKKKGK